MGGLAGGKVCKEEEGAAAALVWVGFLGLREMEARGGALNG